MRNDLVLQRGRGAGVGLRRKKCSLSILFVMFGRPWLSSRHSREWLLFWDADTTEWLSSKCHASLMLYRALEMQ